MPNPKDYSNKQDWMSACMRVVKDEGKPQDQAVAQCLSMWERKDESSNTFVDYYFEKN